MRRASSICASKQATCLRPRPAPQAVEATFANGHHVAAPARRFQPLEAALPALARLPRVDAHRAMAPSAQVVARRAADHGDAALAGRLVAVGVDVYENHLR